ncbi:MAG: HAMP domain-containing sensor histidine kinase [Patescibacteria group bacterium]
MAFAPLRKLNIFAECRALRWRLRECPPFLFLVMGGMTIFGMLATYIVAAEYEEDVQILSVTGVTLVMLILGHFITTGFNRMAEANRMKSEFIAIVSHQLRSPLSIFKWTLDVVGRGMTKDSMDRGRIDAFMETLTTTTEQMIQMVNSLLDVSRIEVGTFSLKKERFSLNDLTAEILNGFRRYVETAHITLEFTPDPGLPPIYADRERLAMVIQNLIDNAVKYTPGSGRIAITAQAVAPNMDMIKWSIKDEGLGIPDDDKRHIFEKFYRADNVRRHHPRGSGMGLYIARAVIEATGGTIGFRSSSDDGTDFWFTLPVEKA